MVKIVFKLRLKYRGDDQISVNLLGILQNWRLMEAEIDTFCRVWYDGIVGQHGSCRTPIIWCSGANQS